MKLINTTKYSAKLFRFCIDEDTMGCTPVVKVCYDIFDNGIRISDVQDWPVSFEPFDTEEYGVIPNDAFFKKHGVDIIVLGEIVLEYNSRQISETEIHVRIGKNFEYCVKVFGKRRWVSNGTQWAISKPELLSSIRTTPDLSFGGSSQLSGMEIPSPMNHMGSGFVLEEENVTDVELPQFEDPSDLISKWDDKSVPVGIGLCPNNGLHAYQWHIDGGDIKKAPLLSLMNNHAFPKMVVPEIKDFDDIELSSRAFRKTIVKTKFPPSTLKIETEIGNSRAEFNLKPDTCAILAKAQRLVITYRAPFTYKVYEMEKRFCKLIENN